MATYRHYIGKSYATMNGSKDIKSFHLVFEYLVGQGDYLFLDKTKPIEVIKKITTDEKGTVLKEHFVVKVWVKKTQDSAYAAKLKVINAFSTVYGSGYASVHAKCSAEIIVQSTDGAHSLTTLYIKAGSTGKPDDLVYDDMPIEDPIG